MPPLRPRSSVQQGVALAAALILLVVVTILAVSAVRFTSGSVGNALNEQLRVTAYTNAQSIIDGVIGIPANLPVTSTAQVYCTSTIPMATPDPCTGGRDVALPAGLLTAPLANNKVTAVIRRREPLQSPPPRGTGVSVNKFFGANFTVEAAYDETDSGQGRDEVSEGLVLILPNS